MDILFTIGCIGLLLGATNDPVPVPAPSLYVDAKGLTGGDGSSDLPFQTIQAALDAATNNSVILVKPGTYSGNLSFGGKTLVLISDKGWEETIINAGFVFNSTNETQVSGFTIMNTGAGAVLCEGGSAPMFVNCSFTSNRLGCFRITNSSPAILNCRFFQNTTPGIFASGASTVKLSHCTFAQNTGTQIYSGDGAQVTLHNSIIWAGIVTNGGTVSASYCDVRGGHAGTGNINADPQFETGGTRLRKNSPCIDRGGPEGLPGLTQFTRFDMDGEVRLNRPDIGADEFVYRIQFPTRKAVRWVPTNGIFAAETNSFSEVDEASGVAYHGTTAIGPVISVIDDEDRDRFHIYQLNADASAIGNSHAIPLLNAAYAKDRNQQEIFDMEGLTFDPRGMNLYLITSQSKRNRYRDVDSSPPIVDPVIDPPSNDYDRRRAMLVRIKLDSSLTNASRADFFEPEQVHAPRNTGYEPTRGLAAQIRQSLSKNPALGDRTITNRVLIARNNVNKFGTPANGVSYPAGTPLPYMSGGPSTTAGEALGEFSGTTGLFTNSGVSRNTWCYYKIWAVDAQTNYNAGIVEGARTDGVPRLFINEFFTTGANAANDPDWIEIYNPAHVPVSLAGLEISQNSADFVPLSAEGSVPARGFLRLLANDRNGGLNLPFKLAKGGDTLVLRRRSPPAEIDRYKYADQPEGVTEGRAWDAGPRGLNSATGVSEGAKFHPGSSYPPTRMVRAGGPTNNHARPLKRFVVTPDVRGTAMYLEWSDVGMLPPVWTYSPKQHDFHAVNVEDIAYRSDTEMIIGLRAPLANRTSGNAYYFVVTNLAAFLPASKWTRPLQGITGSREMDLGGMGIRSLKWCGNGLTNAQGRPVQRYLILAGSANGGPLQREPTRQRFALYAWDGSSKGDVARPQLLIADLYGYAIRPEGLELIKVAGQWRILFVEDRFLSPGYGTRNAIHWPVSVLGPVP